MNAKLVERLREEKTGFLLADALFRNLCNEAASALLAADERVRELERKELELSAALCDEAFYKERVRELEALEAGMIAGIAPAPNHYSEVGKRNYLLGVFAERVRVLTEALEGVAFKPGAWEAIAHIEYCLFCSYSRGWIAEHGHGNTCPLYMAALWIARGEKKCVECGVTHAPGSCEP